MKLDYEKPILTTVELATDEALVLGKCVYSGGARETGGCYGRCVDWGAWEGVKPTASESEAEESMSSPAGSGDDDFGADFDDDLGAGFGDDIGKDI